MHSGFSKEPTTPVSLDDDLWEDVIDLHFPDGNGYVAVLRAYIDASTRTESGLLSVAGYLFESGRVRRFSQEWRKTFGTERFSWADLVNRGRSFKRLGRREDDKAHNRVVDAEHDELVRTGVRLVREYAIAGTIVSCWKQDVENFGPTFIKGFGHAYSIAGHMAMAGMGRWVKRNNCRGGIAYVIEAGDDGYDQLEHLLSYATKSPDVAGMYQWRGHSTAPKTANSPFHAPDLLAWEWGKFIIDTGVEQKRPMRKSLGHLLVNRVQAYSFQHLHGDSLLRFFNAVREIGVEQLQEDRQALSSVSLIDVSEAVAASGPKARDEVPQ